MTVSSDLVARLRADVKAHEITGNGNMRRVQNVRDAIASLATYEALIAEAEGALEPFSRFAGPVFERNFNKSDTITSIGASDGGYCTLTAGDFFTVRTLLTKLKEARNGG